MDKLTGVSEPTVAIPLDMVINESEQDDCIRLFNEVKMDVVGIYASILNERQSGG